MRSRSSTSPPRSPPTPRSCSSLRPSPTPSRSRWRRSATSTRTARPGGGTTSTPVSTPAPTSMRPSHWATGRDGATVDTIAPRRLVGPAVVLDFTERAAADAGLPARARAPGRTSPSTARCPRAPGCCSAPDGAASAATPPPSPTPTTPARTPPASRSPAPSGSPLRRSPVSRVETVGIDAGQAGGLEPPFPVHHFLLGADKYGLTQLQNLDRLPRTGALLVVSPAAGRRRHRIPGPGVRRSSPPDPPEEHDPQLERSTDHGRTLVRPRGDQAARRRGHHASPARASSR